jgi:DNA topoisomerase-3
LISSSSSSPSLPRTETTAYPATFDLEAAVREQASHPAWGRLAQHLSSGRIHRPEGDKAYKDHLTT